MLVTANFFQNVFKSSFTKTWDCLEYGYEWRGSVRTSNASLKHNPFHHNCFKDPYKGFLKHSGKRRKCW